MANAFLGQRQADARMTRLIISIEYREPLIGGTATTPKHRIELRAGD
jgi:hypothetical protein